MTWANFHTHSHYCDGKGPLSDYVTRALALKMPTLGFSSHAPLPFDKPWCMAHDRLAHYVDSINTLKASTRGIQLYAGLEADFVPYRIKPTDFNGILDYTIGSVHFVDELPDGTPWEIDGPHAHFLEGLEKIFHNNARAAMLRYIELTKQMVQTSCPTVIGHLDKIKIQNVDNKLFREDEPWYREAIDDLLNSIAHEGAILEVNTRGIYQKKSATTYPSPWILEHAVKKEIPITLSSDAHHPDDLVNQFTETATVLRTIGFKTLTILYDGSWQPFPFTPDGLIIR